MPRRIAIHDPADRRVADFLDVRERDLVGREGRFMAEGETVLRAVVARSSERVRSVLIVEKRAGKLADCLDRLPPEVPVYLAGQAVADALVGFHLHRGILAVCDRPEPVPLGGIAPPDGPAVLAVLVGLSNHDNVGAVFRIAAAFGAHGVVLDRTTADPFYRKAVRVSSGSVLALPHARVDDAMAALTALRSAGIEPVAFTPDRNATALPDRPLPARAALVLGTEGPGLPPPVLAACERRRIPIAREVDSLNVAVAAAVGLYAWSTAHGRPDQSPAKDINE